MVVIPLLILICYILLKYYMRTYRDLKRLKSVVHSPIMNNLAETLAGATTIRNFKKQQDFITYNYKIVNIDLNVEYWCCAVRRWFSIRLHLASNIIVIFTAGFLVS